MNIEFKDYLNQNNIDCSSISQSLLSDLESYYTLYDIKPAPLLLQNKYSEEEIRDKLDRVILRNYEIKFHNIGSDPYKRYFKYGGHYEWLKTLHMLISHIYYFAKEFKNHELCTYISNRKIAESIGYITKDESDQESVKKALRKVTDSLAILKRMNLITVKHIHYPGNRGSKHLIRLNWLKVLNLFTNCDYNISGSIRIRKIIRYRIISFVKNAKKKITHALRKLMKKQELYFLRDVITFNLERFQDDKYIIFKLLASYQYKYLALNQSDLNTENIIPVIDGNDLFLKIKNIRIYKELNHNMMLINDFKDRYNINLSIVPAF